MRRGGRRSTGARAPAVVRARVVPAEGKSGQGMLRAGALTPYVLETIAEDVLRAGPGARLELTVPPGANAVDLARVRGGCARLRARGVQVDVLRGVADDAGLG